MSFCVAQNILRVRFGLPVLTKRRDLRFEAGVYIKCTRLLILLSVCQTYSTQKLLAKLSVGGEVAFLVHHGLVTPMVVGFEPQCSQSGLLFYAEVDWDHVRDHV